MLYNWFTSTVSEDTTMRQVQSDVVQWDVTALNAALGAELDAIVTV